MGVPQKRWMLYFMENPMKIPNSWMVYNGKSQTKMDHLGGSIHGGTPKSSTLIGFSLISHPFWDTPTSGNLHLGVPLFQETSKSYFNGLVLETLKTGNLLETDHQIDWGFRLWFSHHPIL